MKNELQLDRRGVTEGGAAHRIGYVVMHDRPYYPSVEYFIGNEGVERDQDGYAAAMEYFHRTIKEQMDESGGHRTLVVIAEVIGITEIPTHY